MFQKQLMEVLRRPAEQVWITQLREKLPQDTEAAPKPLDVDTWEKAKTLEHAAAGLNAEQRGIFYQNNDPELAFHAQSMTLLRAALALPEEKRAAFLAALDAPPDLKLHRRGSRLTSIKDYFYFLTDIGGASKAQQIAECGFDFRHPDGSGFGSVGTEQAGENCQRVSWNLTADEQDGRRSRG